MVYNWSIIEHHCLLCDERCEGQPLCSPCEADLPWLDGQCTVCAVPLPSRGLVCGECLKRPPSYDHVEVPWRFAFPVDALITRFKHQARWPYGRLLGERLAHHLEHAFAEGCRGRTCCCRCHWPVVACASAVSTRRRCSPTG